MNNESKSISIVIGGREFKIKSDAEEEYIYLLERFINEKIEEVKKESKVYDRYNTLALTIIKIADEYFTLKKEMERMSDGFLAQITEIEEKIDYIEKNLKEIYKTLEELI